MLLKGNGLTGTDSKYGVMDTNGECLCCHKVEAMEYFKILAMRYHDTNTITQRV